MPGRTGRAALAEQLSVFQRGISCISPAVARLRLNDRESDVWEIAPGIPVRLGAGPAGLAAEMKQFWTPKNSAEGWTAESVGYSYALFEWATRAQTLAYHWHPTGRSHVDTPHLHLGPALLAAMGVEGSIHLPSGQVGLAAFVEMLIREFRVQPARRDWERALRQSSRG